MEYNNNDIKITISLKKEDLECAVCFSSLNQIYQCQKGPHYLCYECNIKINYCPICNNNDIKMIRNIVLEEQLNSFRINCIHNKCPIKIFIWDNDHFNVCKYKPIQCIICNRNIESNYESIINHINNFCDRDFICESHKMDMTITKSNTLFLNLNRTKPSLFILNSKLLVLVICDKKNKVHKISCISENDNIIGKYIQCCFLLKKISYYINIYISQINLIGNYISEIPFDKSEINDIVLFHTIYSEIKDKHSVIYLDCFA
jgi:hypothetical protein